MYNKCTIHNLIHIIHLICNKHILLKGLDNRKLTMSRRNMLDVCLYKLNFILKILLKFKFTFVKSNAVSYLLKNSFV